MSKNLVFSQPPEGVSDEEFGEWYDAHLYEILAVDGFVSAQRFRLEPVVQDEGSPNQFRFLATFELEGDAKEIFAEQERQGLNTRQSYVDFKDANPDSKPPLPTWWDGVRFASWVLTPIGDRVDAAS